jgi:hypothetical protein
MEIKVYYPWYLTTGVTVRYCGVNMVTVLSL